MNNDNGDDFEDVIGETEEKKEKKDIEVITGDGDNLDISPVYDHIKIDKPDINRDRKKQIIIPNAKEENDDDCDENQDEENKKD